MNRPYATREESYAELAASPVLQQLRGHPKVGTIVDSSTLYGMRREG